jgi:hypothetical protein
MKIILIVMALFGSMDWDKVEWRKLPRIIRRDIIKYHRIEKKEERQHERIQKQDDRLHAKQSSSRSE